MKTTTKSAFENFQCQLPFREIYVKYLENNSGSWLCYIAFSCDNSLSNQKLVINIQFTCQHSIDQ